MKLKLTESKLTSKPRLTVLNKIDALNEEDKLLLRQEFAEKGKFSVVLVMSAVSGENVQNVLRQLKKFVITDVGKENSLGETEKDDSPWNF